VLEEEYDGFKFRVLFNKYGYTPHYAEHFVEDDSEKLLMADPHMRRSAFVYNVDENRIEWEYAVKGDKVSGNPHIVRILPEDIPEIGASRGNLVLADRNNEWSFVEIGSGEVQCKLTLPDVKWAHDMLLSKNRDGFIVTDYFAHFLRKIDFKGNVVWRHEDFGPMAKLSVIEGGTASAAHSNSLGGDYLAVRNSAPYGVFEVRDDDGKIVESIPRGEGTLNNFWCYAPHSAFRKGIAEQFGNLTVIGFEAGGGIVALDQWQRPRWGFMKGLTDLGRPHYVPSRYGLTETTHVFPTLKGGVGAIDWSGTYSSRVIEILKWPRSTLSFLLAWDYDPADGTFLDPPLDVMEYNEVVMSISNEGEGAVTGTLYETMLPIALTSGIGSTGWAPSFDRLSIPVMETRRLELNTRGRSFLRLFLKRSDGEKPTKVNVVVSYN
jgi:hypothetical protein